MRKLSKGWQVVLFLLAIAGRIVAGGWLSYHWMFPYGWSHSCDKCLMFALRNYAEDHDSAYPAGEATPEASLSLLYPKYGVDAEILRGKIVPTEVVQTLLARGDRLSPDTCGWHYIEGLRQDDDSRLALFWDKVGLGHNGQRLPDGGHVVFCVNLTSRYVKESEWKAFVEEQKTLLENLKQARANRAVK
jgi:hypothetical protein